MLRSYTPQSTRNFSEGEGLFYNLMPNWVIAS
jgi:hypothetical protein